MAKGLSNILGLAAAAYMGKKTREQDHAKMNAWLTASGRAPRAYEPAPIDKAMNWVGEKFTNLKTNISNEYGEGKVAGDAAELVRESRRGVAPEAPAEQNPNYMTMQQQHDAPANLAASVQEQKDIMNLGERERLEAEQTLNAQEEGRASADKSDSTADPAGDQAAYNTAAAEHYPAQQFSALDDNNAGELNV